MTKPKWTLKEQAFAGRIGGITPQLKRRIWPAMSYMMIPSLLKKADEIAAGAVEAASTWEKRERGPGRGLPYVDTPELEAIRLGHATNQDTSPVFLAALAEDPSERVRRAARANPNAPTDPKDHAAGGDDVSASHLEAGHDLQHRSPQHG